MTTPVGETVRLFFALWPDRAITEKLYGLAQKHASQYGGRAMLPGTLHLTLAFLGDLPAESLELALATGSKIEAAPFGLTLDRLGYWAHNRLLWAGCSATDSGLTSLAAALHERLRNNRFSLEKRAFAPHMTLARNLKTPPPKEAAIAPIEWKCTDFVLVRSALSNAGAAYEIVGCWVLSG